MSGSTDVLPVSISNPTTPLSAFPDEKDKRIRALLQKAEHKDQEALLKNFLVAVEKFTQDKATLHLPPTLLESERRAIVHPQVFLSYAWEAAGTDKLKHLQAFLKGLAKDLSASGLEPWLDIERMTGYMDGQMRDNVHKSQYVLLIGTQRYAERTQAGSQTNVRKELDFTLAEAKKSHDFLLPLLFEGEWGSTFPDISKAFLVRDGRAWFSFEQGQWQAFASYIQELIQLTPLGILPTLLGLNRREDYPVYRKAMLAAYTEQYQGLQAQLQLMQTEHALELTQRMMPFVSRPMLTSSQTSTVDQDHKPFKREEVASLATTSPLSIETVLAPLPAVELKRHEIKVPDAQGAQVEKKYAALKVQYETLLQSYGEENPKATLQASMVQATQEIKRLTQQATELNKKVPLPVRALEGVNRKQRAEEAELDRLKKELEEIEALEAELETLQKELAVSTQHLGSQLKWMEGNVTLKKTTLESEGTVVVSPSKNPRQVLSVEKILMQGGSSVHIEQDNVRMQGVAIKAKGNISIGGNWT